MILESAPVTGVEPVASNVFVLAFRSAALAAETLPGQFVNVKPDASYDPLLRRAYSVHRIQGDRVELIFNVVGKGSAILAAKQPGDRLDIMGPLGVPFHTDGEYSTAILVSGGVGIAPMPVLGEALLRAGRRVVNIHGARTASMLVTDGRLADPMYATDDGSLGFHGNVVGALRTFIEHDRLETDAARVFACGPNRMLEALGEFCVLRGIPLEVSLECQMACGIGICQGCPVEMATGEKKYSLVCTHGPNYDIRDIRLESLPSLH